MRFKLDENLSRSVAELFRGAGHDVTTVHEQWLRGSPDEEVFDASVREQRALVTLDRDLGHILRFPPATSSRIIVIEPGPRFGHPALLERVGELLVLLRTRSPERSLWIVEPGRLRIYPTNGDE